MVPPTLNFLAKSPATKEFDLSSLRVLNNSASGVSPEICEEVRRKFDVVIGQGNFDSMLIFSVNMKIDNL